MFWTTLGTLLCIGLVLLVDSLNFPNLTPDELRRAILIDVLVPAVLAAPVLMFLLSRFRAMAIAHDPTHVFAARDELTGLMSRAAFIADVEETLADARFAQDGVRGSLLIVDIDGLKTVNDRFGHEAGDAALQLITGALRKALRSADRVGRIGGEEFGIFLPSTSPLVAEAVAERIRIAVAKLEFAPDGRAHHLSVSVGGATYDRWLNFVDLFRIADQQLYAAKKNGRNRVSVSSIRHYDTLPAAAA